MDITICIGSSCHLRGSRAIISTLEKLVNDNNLSDEIELKGSFCMGHCQDGVCVSIEDEIFSLTPETAEDFFCNEVLGRLHI